MIAMALRDMWDITGLERARRVKNDRVARMSQGPLGRCGRLLHDQQRRLIASPSVDELGREYQDRRRQFRLTLAHQSR